MKNSFSTLIDAFAASLKVSVALFIIAISMIMSCAAQDFVPKQRSGGRGGFDVESGIATSETITVDGQVFDLYATANGSRYMKLVSPKSGNSYAVWVGQATDYTHEGRTVYVSTKGSYCVYKLSESSGNPYPVWLDKQ